MPDPPAIDYELIDFGDGRKLERFGARWLDRPCPAAQGVPRRLPACWSRADARFERTQGDRGQWQPATAGDWIVTHDKLQLQLKPTPFGHVGVFPEQADNWCYLREQITRAGRPLQVLNLFAYTGASTLSAAAAGASVTHVDAARNVVQWARRNAELSQLSQHPIRWIVEDARLFVQRELKRGRRYDGVILDPPSYGKGPQGETWKLSVDLLPLLRSLRALLSSTPQFFLLTCHSPGFDAPTAAATLQQALYERCGLNIDAKSLSLSTKDGHRLDAGVVARTRSM